MHLSVCRRLAVAMAFAIVTVESASAHGPSAPLSSSPLTIVPLGSVNTGGAEISAYDPRTRRLFVTDAGNSKVAIVDASNPANLTNIGSIDVLAFGSPTSVAVLDGVVAVAIANAIKTDPGTVAFFRTNGELINSVKAGALPDMLTFTHDGKYLLVANEGEPSGYGVGFADPEGSISIIPMPRDLRKLKTLKSEDVRFARFTQYNGKEAALRAQGIRIYGPGATTAMDFEPEYITVAADSRKAYVTLQENNAIAELDIAAGKFLKVTPLGYKDQNKAPYTVATYEWPNEQLPPVGTTAGGNVIRLGGFSGLDFEGVTADGKLKFIANTDRGPNGEPDATLQRPFVLPQFAPRLVRFTLDPSKGKLELTQQILLRNSNGKPLTGLPNIAIAGANPNTPNNDEVPIDLFGNVIPLDPLGGDFEAIVVDEDGTFWLCDEYRPAIYHFDDDGRLLQRYIPKGVHAAASLPVPPAGMAGPLGIEVLPAVIGQRRQNRGMEALALKDGKLYAFVQSPLRNPPAVGNAALNGMRNVRVVEFDPATLATRQFIYIMDNPLPAPANDTRADKIGDMASVPGGGFLAVERDDDNVPAIPLENITKKIYAFKLDGATDVSAVDTLYDVGGVMKSLDQMTSAELIAVGVTPVLKTLHADLAAAGYAGVQKVEGLTLLDDGRLAVVNDNDFRVAQIKIANGGFTLADGYVPENIVLGLISVPGLDASDRDTSINIRNWPVLGMYEPDAIANFSVRGRTYLVTANEGDARDWPGLTEEVRVGAGSVVLDPTAFPNAAALKQNAALGRLNVTNTIGDTDGDGDYDQLFTLGGRSFSIWKTDGTQVFDSEAALERITAAEFPANFNASNDNNNFDDRSDNKGPEPEGLALGEIGGRTYAFVGLERIGGVAAYDISDPDSPLFADYVNNRDFTAAVTTPEAGDLGPEGLLFIPANESPNRRPMLFVSNEISGTVTAYGLEVCVRKHGRHGWRGWFRGDFGFYGRCYR
jgi:hypothetical protein